MTGVPVAELPMRALRSMQTILARRPAVWLPMSNQAQIHIHIEAAYSAFFNRGRQRPNPGADREVILADGSTVSIECRDSVMRTINGKDVICDASTADFGESVLIWIDGPRLRGIVVA
jgi:hypothetical protein